MSFYQRKEKQLRHSLQSSQEGSRSADLDGQIISLQYQIAKESAKGKAVADLLESPEGNAR